MLCGWVAYVCVISDGIHHRHQTIFRKVLVGQCRIRSHDLLINPVQKYMTATIPLHFHKVLSYLLAIVGTRVLWRFISLCTTVVRVVHIILEIRKAFFARV